MGHERKSWKKECYADRPELLAHLPNFRQEWVQECRRFSMMERPAAFNAVLRAFLTGLAA